MTEEKRKKISVLVRGLYLYSYRSFEENLVRGIAWITSWIIGIAIVQTTDIQAKGGAYFIYAFSMLLEFVPEKNKPRGVPRVVHGLFCFILIIMFFLSVAISFGNNYLINNAKVCSQLYSLLNITGIIIIVMIVISLVLVVIQAHKLFYSDEEEKSIEENLQADDRIQSFYTHLNGDGKDSI